MDGKELADAGARLLAEWIGYSWDGMREGRIEGYPQWATNGIGTLHFQGGKQDLRDLAEKIAALRTPVAVGVPGEERQERAKFALRVMDTLNLFMAAVRNGEPYSDEFLDASNDAHEALKSLLLPSPTNQGEVEKLRAALQWIAEIADANYEQDAKLRAQGARTLKRISDRARDALAGGD